MRCPPLWEAEHDGIRVVRDDIVLGGTKARVVPALLAALPADEWVYAGPAEGYAQVALALGCRAAGCAGTLFTPQRNEPAPLTRLAMRLGLSVVMVPAGRLNVLRARARDYCEMTGALLAPLGLHLPGMEAAVAELAAQLPAPAEVWVAAGSGLLARSLAAAWPSARINAVAVGHAPDLPPGATLWRAPEPFARPSSGPAPPYPSVATYDAKVWPFAAKHAARDGSSLVWNVAAECPPPPAVDACLAAGTLDLRHRPGCPDTW